jgi:hypothetical protein
MDDVKVFVVFTSHVMTKTTNLFASIGLLGLEAIGK